MNIHPNPNLNPNPDPDSNLGGWHADFTTINTTILAHLAAERCCSVCGQPMKYWVHRAELRSMQQAMR